MQEHQCKPLKRGLDFPRLDKISPSLATRLKWQHCTDACAHLYKKLCLAIEACFSLPTYQCRDPLSVQQLANIRSGKASVQEKDQFLRNVCKQYKQDVEYYNLVNDFMSGNFYEKIPVQQNTRSRSIINDIRAEYEDDGVLIDNMLITYVYHSLPFNLLEKLIFVYPDSSMGGSLYQQMEEYIQFVIVEIKRSQVLQEILEEERQQLQAYLVSWEIALKRLRAHQKAAATAMKNWLKSLPGLPDSQRNKSKSAMGNVLLDIMLKLEANGIEVAQNLKECARHSPQHIADSGLENAMTIAENIIEHHASEVTVRKLKRVNDDKKINTLGRVAHLSKYYTFSAGEFEGQAIAAHIDRFFQQQTILEHCDNLSKLEEEDFDISTELSQTFKNIRDLSLTLEAEKKTIQNHAFYAKCWKNRILRFLGFQHQKAADFFNIRMMMIDDEMSSIERAKKKLINFISKNIDIKIMQDIQDKKISKNNVVTLHQFVSEESNEEEMQVEFKEKTSVNQQVTLFIRENCLIKMNKDLVVLSHVRYQVFHPSIIETVIEYFEEIVRYAAIKSRRQHDAVAVLIEIFSGKWIPKTREDFNIIESKMICLCVPATRTAAIGFIQEVVEKIVYPLKRGEQEFHALIQEYTPHLDRAEITEDIKNIYKSFIHALLTGKEVVNDAVTILYGGEKIVMRANTQSVQKIVMHLIDVGEKDFIIQTISERIGNITDTFYAVVGVINDEEIFESFIRKRFRAIFPDDSDLFIAKNISDNDRGLFSSPQGKKFLESILSKQFSMIAKDRIYGGKWSKALSRYIRLWGTAELIEEDKYLECMMTVDEIVASKDISFFADTEDEKYRKTEITKETIAQARKEGCQEVDRIIRYMSRNCNNKMLGLIYDEFQKEVLYSVETANIGVFLHQLELQHLCHEDNTDNDALVVEMACIKKFLRFIIFPEDKEDIILSQEEAEIIFIYFEKISCKPKVGKILEGSLAGERAKFFVDCLSNNKLNEFKQYCQEGVIFMQRSVVETIIEKMSVHASENDIIFLLQRLQYPEKITTLLRQQLAQAFVTYWRETAMRFTEDRQILLQQMSLLLGLKFVAQENLIVRQLEHGRVVASETNSQKETTGIGWFKETFLSPRKNYV